MIQDINHVKLNCTIETKIKDLTQAADCIHSTLSILLIFLWDGASLLVDTVGVKMRTLVKIMHGPTISIIFKEILTYTWPKSNQPTSTMSVDPLTTYTIHNLSQIFPVVLFISIKREDRWSFIELVFCLVSATCWFCIHILLIRSDNGGALGSDFFSASQTNEFALFSSISLIRDLSTQCPTVESIII